MRTFGLIGYPLSQSFSQKYFTAKFEREIIDEVYHLLPIPSIDDFPALLQQYPGISGMNVTIPYKEQVMPFLTSLNPVAAEIGAVNVIKFNWDGDKPTLTGYNTDTIGFTRSIEPFLKSHHTKALILGTGGAAKSVAYSLGKLGLVCTYVSRTPVDDTMLTYARLNDAILKEYTVIVNASPLGMYPKVDACPDIPYHLLTSEHLLYDLVYNPEVTLFLQKGLERGAAIKNGLEMLHIQADEAWKIWNE